MSLAEYIKNRHILVAFMKEKINLSPSGRLQGLCLEYEGRLYLRNKRDQEDHWVTA